MVEGDEGGAGGEAVVVVEAVAEAEAPLPSFMAHRYPSTTRRTTTWTTTHFSCKHFLHFFNPPICGGTQIVSVQGVVCDEMPI